MPDVTAGAQLSTKIDLEAVSAITGDIAPLPHPPAAQTEANPHGPIAVESRPPEVAGTANFAADIEFAVKPGEHPDDRTAPSTHPNDMPVPYDTAGGDAPRGEPSFDTDNDEATPVFQRAAEAWTGQQFTITGPTQIARRQKGRQGVTIFVPATDMNGNAINGVTIAPDDSEVQNVGGMVVGSPLFLLPGASISIDTEAPVWAGLIGSNANGFVCVLIADNPSGGQLGGL